MADVDAETGPVALVTGASRGIGRAIAVGLAQAGYRVAVTARDAEGLAETCAAAGPGSLSVAADLTDPGAPDRILAAIGAPLTVLVNNAGTAPSDRFTATDDTALDLCLELHVRAPFRLLRAAVPAMQDRPGACAVQLASTAGLVGFPFTSAYTAAKHGMVGLTRALAAEFGKKGPRMFAVCPGFVDTDITRQAARDIAARGKQTEAEALAALAAMNHIGRMHSPEEVAGTVLQLIQERPAGCVYNLDQDPPGFVD